MNEKPEEKNVQKIKAFYGKLSILCCVISLISIGAMFSEFFAFMFIVLFFSLPSGFLFGYLSASKQETPRFYRYVGFLLNFVGYMAFVIPLFFAFIRGMR